MKYASLWLLNPMVATISTRGSSEGLLGVMVIALLWTVEKKEFRFAGWLLGLAVHFKIYPFIYAPAILWWIGPNISNPSATVGQKIKAFITKDRITFTANAINAFMGLNFLMMLKYG